MSSRRRPGTRGGVPAVYTFGAAYLGNARFGVEIESDRPNSNAFYLIASRRMNLTIGGLTLLVDTLNSAGAIVSATTDSEGRSFIGLPVPFIASLVGVDLHVQALVADPGGPLNHAASAGRTFEIFVR